MVDILKFVVDIRLSPLAALLNMVKKMYLPILNLAVKLYILGIIHDGVTVILASFRLQQLS